jgi:predicted NAD/FAD-dependent oxidoreductase
MDCFYTKSNTHKSFPCTAYVQTMTVQELCYILGMINTIVIIGSGISGLRAGLELAQHSDNKIIILEKSKSVGGRVATRRFDSTYVNHGAEKFDGLQRVLDSDSKAQHLLDKNYFEARATDLPKRLYYALVYHHGSKVSFKFDWEVSKLINDTQLQNTNGELLHFDQLIITAPVPQIEKITETHIPNIKYNKCILFIGEINNNAIRIEMNPIWSEEFFDLTDEEIFLAAKNSKYIVEGLKIKKWRYATVQIGIKESFLKLKENIYVAGDAFDPECVFNLGSSWLSGMNTAKEILALHKTNQVSSADS